MWPFLICCGYKRKDAKKRAYRLLQILGLERFQNYKPMDLSGGQQQRISLLRALVNNPKILMADEPTGNLDSKSSNLLMELFKSINEELGRTIVMVTHNLDLLPYATKVIHILDGQITKIDLNKPPRKLQNEKNNDILDISKSFVKTAKEEEQEEEMAVIG
jgi:putative ABC transport system ATP-binding protein